MVKAALLIYVVGVGVGSDYQNSGSTSVSTYDSMEQCKIMEKTVQESWDAWHYGNDKKKVVEVKHTMKCVDLPAVQDFSSPPTISPSTQRTPLPTVEIPQRRNKRWDW